MRAPWETLIFAAFWVRAQGWDLAEGQRRALSRRDSLKSSPRQINSIAQQLQNEAPTNKQEGPSGLSITHFFDEVWVVESPSGSLFPIPPASENQ